MASGVDLDGATLRATVAGLVAGARAAGCADVTVVAPTSLGAPAAGDCPVVAADGDPKAVLEAVLEVARRVPAGRTTVLARADVVTAGWALRQLVTDPAGRATALTVRPPSAGAPARVEDGVVTSAASAAHTVTAATAALPGAVCASADRIAAAAATALGSAAATAPGADAVDLVTVALVRSGAPVAAVAGDVSAARRARGSDEARDALAVAGSVDERAVRTAAAVKTVDSAFTTFLVSPYSRYVARWAAERRLTPNQVTVASLLVGVAAAVAFGFGDRVGLVVGAVLLQVSFTLDCVDGELARYARVFSPVGGWLDASFDRLKEYAVYAGLAVGAGRSGDDVWLLAASALALQVFRHAVDFGFATRHADRRAAPPPLFDQVSDVATAPARPVEGIGGGVVRLSAATSRTRALMYAKRMVILPIGERWALISLCAAVADARVAFLALLAWGGLAAAYTLTGRVLRSVAGA